jgi:NADPH2:quinone reductase
LTVENVPDPVAGPGEVVIEVRSAGVNFPDVLVVQNKYQYKPQLPFSPGNDMAGVVAAIGEGVTGIRVGDRVIASYLHGAFATRAVVPAAAVMPMPQGLDFDIAAGFLMTYGTSYHALVDRAQLLAGETLLVLGAAGGVGLAAVEIGHALGARVIACASSDDKLAACRQSGADVLINYTQPDFREQIKLATGGRGADVIYDAVGGDFSEAAFRSIAWKGRHLIVGFASGTIPKIPMNLPLLKNASIVGVFWGEFKVREREANAKNFEQVVAWIREGRIKPYISRRYRLDEAAQALTDMGSRKVIGKVVINP